MTGFFPEELQNLQVISYGKKKRQQRVGKKGKEKVNSLKSEMGFKSREPHTPDTFICYTRFKNAGLDTLLP